MKNCPEDTGHWRWRRRDVGALIWPPRPRRFRSVVVITLASHARGPGFETRRNLGPRVLSKRPDSQLCPRPTLRTREWRRFRTGHTSRESGTGVDFALPRHARQWNEASGVAVTLLQCLCKAGRGVRPTLLRDARALSGLSACGLQHFTSGTFPVMGRYTGVAVCWESCILNVHQSLFRRAFSDGFVV